MIYRVAHNLPFYYGWVILFAAGSSMFARNAAGSLTLAVFIYPISQELGWSRTLIAGANPTALVFLPREDMRSPGARPRVKPLRLVDWAPAVV